MGALIGLAGTLVLGKRRDKEFGKSTIRGHKIPLAAMGTFVLWLGWFGFNGSQLNADPEAISLIVITTDFAATAGAISAMFISYFHTKEWGVSMGMNGCLGGLVTGRINRVGGAVLFFAATLDHLQTRVGEDLLSYGAVPSPDVVSSVSA